MPESLVTVAYIVAGLLFIMSLSGLSAQATAARGNIYGIVGMVIAAVATAFGPRAGGYPDAGRRHGGRQRRSAPCSPPGSR